MNYGSSPPVAGSTFMGGYYELSSGRILLPKGFATATGQNGELVMSLAVGMDGTQYIVAQGSPDSGLTFKPLKVANDGSLVNQTTLQPSTNIVGIAYDFDIAVMLGLVGTRKIWIATGTMNNSGGAAETIAWVDSNGNAGPYVVPNGKTFHIRQIHSTLDLNSTGAIQDADCAITDGTNAQHKWTATSNGAAIPLATGRAIGQGKTLTLTATASNLTTAAGSITVVVEGVEL